ncbi:MAG: F0F1 ATP synthase subunit delta [Candidatus Paceibacterota bacterium]
MTLSRKIATYIVEKNVSIGVVSETLQEYKLLSLLPSILKAVTQMKSDDGARDTVLIETPFEASEESIAHIKRIVGNDIAPHRVTVNKNLLAGFKARFKGKLYDGSAERVLRQLTNY